MRWLSSIFARSSCDRLTERRRQERLGVHVPVRCQRLGGQLTGTLLELSQTGVGLELASSARPGERLQISPPPDWAFSGRRTVTCEVVWCRPTGEGTFMAGLRHVRSLAGSWLEPRLQGLHQEGRSGRAHRRFSVLLPARVATPDGVFCPGSLMDVSLGGAQLRVAAAPQPGQFVHLEVAGLRLVASVVGSTPVCDDRSLVNLRFLKAQPGLGKLKKWLSKLPCAAAPGLCAA